MSAAQAPRPDLYREGLNTSYQAVPAIIRHGTNKILPWTGDAPKYCKHCASLRRNTDRRIGLGAAARTRRRACAASPPAFSAATVLCAAARDRVAARTTSGRPARRPHATAAPTTPYVPAARAHPQPTAHNMRAPAGSRCTARRGAAAGRRELLRDGGGRGGGGPGVDPSRRSVSASKGRRGVSTCARELKGGADAAQAAHLASKSSSRRRYLRN